MPEVFHETDRRTFWAAAGVIAASYGYFLIFAEFAFLELVRGGSDGAEGLRPAMAAMGIAGVAGSLLAAWRFRAAAVACLLGWGSLACAAAGGLALAHAGVVAAAGIGLSLGWMTVTLAAGLRAVVGMRRLGRVIGLGTGLAYAVVNVPAVFSAPAQLQTVVAVALMVVAAVATRWLAAGPAEQSGGADFQAMPAAGWVVIFMALVWMDSAAFYIIQHTPSLRDGTWGDEWNLWANAGVHFSVAVGAGVMLDRGWLGRIVLAAWVMLAVACLLLGENLRFFAAADVLYAAGVSLYSVAVVYFPARSGRAWLTGVLFAVAGWIGSALGIGMAQDLNTVPEWFVGAAGVVVVGLLLKRQRARHGLRQPLLGLLVVAGAGVLAMTGTPARATEEDAAQVVRGREVFIAEGCIHCHSQFVRPGTVDVTRWGPEKTLESVLAERPPLPGNRRQGPDLAQAGNRRTPEWNRLHLIAPRAVSPGSRMPSYGHLFRDGDGRGGDLVAYLASLGAETAGVRIAQTQAWRPAETAVADPAKGARLFALLCATCHGAAGKGDGMLAEKLSVRPPDWTRDPWRRVDAAAEAESLARIIAFGLPGSPMAGHEYLRDDEVVSLARHVRSLHAGATVP